jgi:hypothetical protein
LKRFLPLTAIDMVAKENADYSPKAIPCLILAMSDFGPLLTCLTSAQMSGLWGGADQRLMDWRGRLLTRSRTSRPTRYRGRCCHALKLFQHSDSMWVLDNIFFAASSD